MSTGTITTFIVKGVVHCAPTLRGLHSWAGAESVLGLWYNSYVYARDWDTYVIVSDSNLKHSNE